MRLADIMSTQVYSASAGTPVAEVAKAMSDGRFGSAVIMDEDRVAGIFTERDALRCVSQGCDPASTAVSDWMTAEPVTTTPDTQVEDAATQMIERGFRHLPVVDGTELVGIVSLRDVLRVRVDIGD